MDMAVDPEWGAELLRRLGAEAMGDCGLRRVAVTDDGFGDLVLDWEPRIAPVDRSLAMAFVAEHHEHNGPLAFDIFRAGVWNGSTLLVVAANPTSSAYMNRNIAEVRRLYLDRRVPHELRWRACSMLYKWAAKEAERLGWERIITYTLDSESGMSLRYARWKCEGPASREEHTWARRGRNRQQDGPTGAKVRWAKALKPIRRRAVQATFAFPRQARPPRRSVA